MMARNLELKQFTMLQEYLLNTNRCAAKPAAFLFLFLCKLQRIIVKISVVVYAKSQTSELHGSVCYEQFGVEHLEQ